MKLLERQSLNNDLQEQRRAQAEEGIRLAKRIDALRETLSTLEKQHQDFIESSRTTYQEAIGALERRKDELEKEIVRLEERRALLREPLDKEWESLEEAQKDHEKKALSLAIQEASIAKRDSVVLEKEKKAEQRERALNDMSEAIEQERAFVSHEKEKATSLTLKLREEEKRSVSEQKERERITLKKDEESDRRARAIDMREKLLNAREKSIDKREAFVDHKYKVLQRTIKRIKK